MYIWDERNVPDPRCTIILYNNINIILVVIAGIIISYPDRVRLDKSLCAQSSRKRAYACKMTSLTSGSYGRVFTGKRHHDS